MFTKKSKNIPVTKNPSTITEKGSDAKLELIKIIKGLPLPIIILSSGNIILTVNISAKELIGKNDIEGKDINDYMPFETDEPRLNNSGATFNNTSFLLKAGGEKLSIYFYYRDIYFRNEKYKVIYFNKSHKNNYKILDDILQAFKIEMSDKNVVELGLINVFNKEFLTEKNQESNDNIKTLLLYDASKFLLEGFPDMLFILDLKGNFIEVNEKTYNTLGYSREELLKMNFLSLLEADASQIFTTYFKNSHQSAEIKYQTALICAKKDMIPIEFSAKLTIRNDESVIICAIRDLHLNRQSEQESLIANEKITYSEKDFENIFNHLNFPILLFDNQIQLLSLNTKAAELFNSSDLEDLKACFGQIVHCSIYTLHQINCGFNENCSDCAFHKLKGIKVQKDSTTYQQEINQIFEKNGLQSQNTLSVIIKVLNAGKEAILLVTTEDITEYKKNEIELTKVRELAEEESRLRAVFLNNLSRELRTPLNGILGFSDLLLNSGDPNDFKQFIDFIHKSGKQLLYVIDDVSTVSSILSKSVQINPRRITLSELLSDTQVTLNEEKLISDNNNVELKISIPENVDEQYITIDPSIYVMIIKKLAKNAFRYTQNGSVEFGMEFNERKEPVFYLKDTGIGIEPELFEKIFQLFKQGSDESSKKYGGTGSGLAISKGLVELLNGKIWVESKVGEGSTFYFYIPSGEVTSKVSSPIVKSEYTGSFLSGKTILIIEDDDFNYCLLEAYLDDTGATVIHASNGEEGVSMVKSNDTIDLVLMDMRLPDISGIVATSMIKKIRPKLNIIGQSALTTPEDIEQALNAGCDDYLVKPINYKHLLEVIYNVLA